MRSLRVKLTLALLAMSFIAIAVVGATSRWLMLRRVDVLVAERALQGFVQHAAAYYEAYGSWSKARESEPYLAFQQRVYGVPLQPPPSPRGSISSRPSAEEQEGMAESAPDTEIAQPAPEQAMRRPSDGETESGPSSGSGMNAAEPSAGLRLPPPRNGMRPPPPNMGMRRPPMGAAGMTARPPGAGMRPPPPNVGMRRPPPGAGTQYPAMGGGPGGPPPFGEENGDQPGSDDAANPPAAQDDSYDYSYSADQGAAPSSTQGDTEAYVTAPEQDADSSSVDEAAASASPGSAARPAPPGHAGRTVPASGDVSMPGPLLGEGNGGPPVPVVITNLSGTVVVPLAGMHVGDEVSHEDYKHSRPILAGGRRVGLAVPLKRPTRTALEQQYLAAIRDSWVYSLLLAAVLAIPLGLILGSRFATPIVELTGAIGRMRRGILRQSVPVRGEDEIAQLSTSFNQMSDELANTYNELKASREQLSEQAEMLKELSRRDELTGLLNRRAFDEQAALMFEQARRFGHPLTLAMVDIDHFKQVNDDYSHAVGDAVLREVAHLIGSKVREIDLVARYGGEEFAMAFMETPLDAAGKFLDKLRQLVAAHDWEKITPGLRLTLSAGLSNRTMGSTLGEVLDLADARLHEAKTNGRNLVCY